MRIAEENGAKLSSAGRSMVLNFENALNPTKLLAVQIEALEKSGKSAAEIQSVLGDKIRYASEQAVKHGQAIDPVVRKHYEAVTAGDKWTLSIESLGKSLTGLASNPLQAAQSGIAGFLEKLGPTAVGIGGIAAAAGLAGKKLFDMASAAADNMERLDNLAAQTGLTTQQLEALELITETAGLKGLELGKVLSQLNAQLGEGKGDFIDSLDRLGLSMIDLASGKPKDALALLDEMWAKLHAIPDATERTLVANDALSGRLRDLVPLLLNSNKPLGEQIDHLIRLGATTDDLTRDHLRAFDKKLDDLRITMAALTKETQGFLSKALNALNDGLAYTGRMLGIAFGKNMKDATEATHRQREAQEKLNKTNEEAAGFTTFVALSDVEQNRRSKEVTDSLRKQEAAQKALNDRLDELKQAAYNSSFTDIATSIYDVAKAIPEIPKGIQEINFELAYNERASRQWLDEVTKDVELYSGAGVNLEATMKDVFGEISAQGEVMGETLSAALKESGQDFDGFGKDVSGIFAGFTQSLAKNTVEFKGWKDTCLNTIKGFAETALGALYETLFSPLNNLINKAATWFGNWATSGLENLLGLSKSGAAAGLFGGSSGGLGGLLGLGGTTAGSMASGGILGGTAGSAGAAGAGSGAATGGGLSALGHQLWAFASNPITLAVAGAAAAGYGIYKLVDLIQGPDSWEAMSEEIARDFAGVKVSPSICQAFGKAVGITEPEAWKFRHNIKTSPMFLLNVVAPAAEEQGKFDAFLQTLSRIGTSWGTFDFLPGFMKGLETGEWSLLNKAWTDTGMGDANFGRIVTGGATALYIPTAASSSPTASGQEEIPAYAAGTAYVPRDGLAYLHKGEAVIPADRNSAAASINISINGPVYGLDDLDRKLSESIRRIRQRGGLSFMGAGA